MSHCSERLSKSSYDLFLTSGTQQHKREKLFLKTFEHRDNSGKKSIPCSCEDPPIMPGVIMGTCNPGDDGRGKMGKGGRQIPGAC